MIEGFFDRAEGGFFDTRITSAAAEQNAHGILGTPRKPFQDSPTPAGNPAAAIALLRLHAYTNEPSYSDKAESTLELYAAGAAQHGIFAATYGLAVARFAEPHTQVVIVGNDDAASRLCKAARHRLSFNTSVICLDAGNAVAQNLPPVLGETIPRLPALTSGRSFAVVCSDFTCQPAIFEADELQQVLNAPPSRAA